MSSIWIKDAVYVDNREYWRNIDSYKPMNSCPYPNIYACSPGSIRSEIMKAIAEVISLSGLAGNPINTVYFANSCSALAKIQWPAGAFIDQPGGDGQPSRRIELSNSITYSLIPCDGMGCCKVSYLYVPIVTENGYTEDRYVVAGYSFVGACGGSPDLNSWTNRPNASIVDPNTGEITTVYGNPIDIEECKPMCNTGDVPPIPLVKTDVTELTKSNVEFELTAAPTQFSSYIKFVSTTPIQKISVFDASGKKVSTSLYTFEDNELKTIELKSGIYYVQAHFAGNRVRTIKVIKE